MRQGYNMRLSRFVYASILTGCAILLSGCDPSITRFSNGYMASDGFFEVNLPCDLRLWGGAGVSFRITNGSDLLIVPSTSDLNTCDRPANVRIDPGIVSIGLHNNVLYGTCDLTCSSSGVVALFYFTYNLFTCTYVSDQSLEGISFDSNVSPEVLWRNAVSPQAFSMQMLNKE